MASSVYQKTVKEIMLDTSSSSSHRSLADSYMRTSTGQLSNNRTSTGQHSDNRFSTGQHSDNRFSTGQHSDNGFSTGQHSDNGFSTGQQFNMRRSAAMGEDGIQEQGAGVSRRSKERSLLPCQVCGKIFDRPSLLKRHTRTHTGFSTSSSLNTHRRIHSGEKPHQCSTCGKRFTASSNLYYHRMTHIKVQNGMREAHLSLRFCCDENSIEVKEK
ncbi:hypothetical protein Pcinc_007383 [Petrolisthes cinctipes]|uniref:C2H2-type domain-containing protein n=1 Tax=Petrolisthes cinctipes TaxID=88211 RepID=A0AAE1GB29_PETCI|nr:hypothetical protein Pcinc_007383 [Petrolisthes cinctipes]